MENYLTNPQIFQSSLSTGADTELFCRACHDHLAPSGPPDKDFLSFLPHIFFLTLYEKERRKKKKRVMHV